MRTFCRKLSKFIRLADFIVCNSYISIAIHSTHDLLSHMVRGQELVDEEKVSEPQAANSSKKNNTTSNSYPYTD